MRPSAILKGTSEEHKKQKKDGGRHSNAEKNLPKVKSTVSFGGIPSGVVFDFLQISGL